MVLANAATGTNEMSLANAKQAGAIGLFGEKYGEQVRVVEQDRAATSVELCGGTHVARAGDIGLLQPLGDRRRGRRATNRGDDRGQRGALDWIQESQRG